ncbi:MAG: discoidin domain-containing protein [Nitrospirae bacterium]|nr:discoidin domain-containing protein [Nitrospirota bacterium]
MKRAVLLFLFLFQFILISSAFAQTPAITDGLNYLSASQNPDGSWGNDASGTEILPSTVSTIETLQLLNQTGTPSYNTALSWLQLQALDTTDYLSERIHALTVAGTDENLLLSYLDDLTGAWGGYDDYEVNNLDTVLSLLALKKINYSDQNTISSVLYYLTTTQNPDGGWGFSQGDDSNVYMTAAVLNILSQFKATYNLQTPINNAVAYLLTKQNPDGGFGSSPSTVYETSLAFEALLASGAVGSTNASVIQNALNYLTSTQLPDGSWDDDPYSTALALRALAGATPNLTLSTSEITYSPSFPTPGDIVTIKAVIKNTGFSDANNTSVSFFDGDPDAGGIFIGEAIVSGIVKDGSRIAEMNWTASSSGNHDIYVRIDYANTVLEMNESDNTAVVQIRVYEKIDLAIQGITFTPVLPAPNEMINVQVKTVNLGGLQASNVTLRLAVDGATIGDHVIANLGSLQTQTLTFSLQNLAKGIHQIVATLDPDNSISEGNETNNSMGTSVEVRERIDLVAINTAIFLSNINPKEGETIQIAAVVYNVGVSAAGNVAVKFYDGDPAANGVQIGSDQIIPTIPAGGAGQTGWVPYNTLGKAGQHKVYAVVDPSNVVEETAENNNIASSYFTVTGRPDFIAQDILFSPLSPEEGDMVQVRATIRNGGSQAGSAFVRFYLGDPSAGGQQIGADMLVSANPSSNVSTGNVFLNTAERVGDNQIFLVIDPLNALDEIDETNNIMSKILTVKPSTRPDLTLGQSDISFYPLYPITGDAVTISARIRNLRNTPASNVTVNFYDGSPSTGGILLGSVIVPNVAGMGSEAAQLTWTATGIKGKHAIYVKIDPNNAITEANESNNEASAYLKIRIQVATPQNLTASPISPTDIGLNWDPSQDASSYGIVGYNVYRDNLWVNRLTDISREGTVSASSTYVSYTPDKAIDGSTTSFWWAATNAPLPQWWQEDFASARKVKKVAIYWYSSYYAKGFEVQTWDGTQWVTQSSVTGNDKEITIHDFPASVVTDKIRIHETTANNPTYPAGIREVDIYEDRLVEAANYQDRGLGNGTHSYFVTAVDAGGAESLPSNVAKASLGDASPPAPPSGLSATANGFNIGLSWLPNTEPDLAGYRVYRDGLNIAHKDRGTIIIGTNGSALDSVIDGNQNTVGYTQWNTTPPGVMTIIFPIVYRLDKIRMLLYEGDDDRSYRYIIESSTDGRNWQTVVDRTSGDWQGLQEITFAQPFEAKYFRITGAFCSAENYFKVSEFEAYTSDLASKTLDTSGVVSFGITNYSNFYEYTYNWNGGSAQPRRFVFSDFDTEENDVLYILNKDTGMLLGAYSGKLGAFVTSPLAATNYRFQFIADSEGTGQGIKMNKYFVAGRQTASTFSETIYENDTYHYAVSAIDTSGNESELSFAVAAVIGDTTPPGVPNGLTADVDDGVVKLRWTSNIESDLAGYNLYRNGEATPLNGGTLITENSYTDLNVMNLTTYTYQITALDINGNESARSASVTAIPSGADLVLDSMVFSPFPAQKNSPVEIAALIKNKGTKDAVSQFKVSFYAGNPRSGGELIGTKSLNGLEAGQAEIVQMSVTPVNFTTYIFVVIDPDNSVPESDEANNESYALLVAFDNLKTLYTTYTFTLNDIVLFSYRNNAQITVFRDDQSLLWNGTVNEGQYQILLPGNGIYKVYSTQPFTVISGDPISDLVMGYYALDERNLGLSKNFYTYMIDFWGIGCKFIVFAYEDETQVQVINSETNTLVWSGTLNKGQHYENADKDKVGGKFLRVVSSKPVSALSPLGKRHLLRKTFLYLCRAGWHLA